MGDPRGVPQRDGRRQETQNVRIPGRHSGLGLGPVARRLGVDEMVDVAVATGGQARVAPPCW